MHVCAFTHLAAHIYPGVVVLYWLDAENPGNLPKSASVNHISKKTWALQAPNSGRGQSMTASLTVSSGIFHPMPMEDPA